MKKIVGWALMMAVLLGLSAPALAQGSAALEGIISEVTDEGFLLEDVESGTVYVLWKEETVWDGVAQKETLAAGQYVYVEYDGKLTRSLPPQATADRVGCYTLSGTIGEILEDGFLLEGDAVFGQVIVAVPEGAPHAYKGADALVYYNGGTAMSNPGRVGAARLVVPTLEGTATDVSADGFTLTDDAGTAWQVRVSADTNGVAVPAENARVQALLRALPESADAPAEALEVQYAQSESY